MLCACTLRHAVPIDPGKTIFDLTCMVNDRVSAHDNDGNDVTNVFLKPADGGPNMARCWVARKCSVTSRTFNCQ